MAEHHRLSPAQEGDEADPERASDDEHGLDGDVLDQLGWTPSWRDRLDAVLDGTSPARLAAGVAVAVVVAAVVGLAVLRGPAPPPAELTLPVAGGPGDPALSTTTSTTAAAAAEVVVHAAGSVAAPGVYRLAAGSRVADLLDAAGGSTGMADLDRLNLAAPLADGDRVFVPEVGEDVPPVVSGGGAAGGAGPPADPSSSPSEPVDLNAATLAELDTLPGVGPATAEAIVAERERRGGFTAVEDLLGVRGIGDAKLAALRDLVRV